ncbi:MAG TPA: oxidoreductase [Blastocatellia bacterium]|nr:oxidoreductase [Blastocatellia bacterium]
MARLQNKVAVVTASAMGIGEGIARLFADEGAKVVISDIADEAGQAVAAGIVASGAQAIYQHCDVAVESDCRALIDRAVAEYGRIDVLANVAGLSTRGDIENTSVELWDRLFAVNVRGAFILMQQAVKYMKPQFEREQRGGSIINIGSVNAYIGEPKLMAYSATKGALMTLTKNTAAYLNRYRIRVNQINPGWTLTPNEHRVKLAEGKGENWVEEAVRTRPFGRLLLPGDIALAAIYFASDESECVTGTVMDLEQYPVGGPPNW